MAVGYGCSNHYLFLPMFKNGFTNWMMNSFLSITDQSEVLVGQVFFNTPGLKLSSDDDHKSF